MSSLGFEATPALAVRTPQGALNLPATAFNGTLRVPSRAVAERARDFHHCWLPASLAASCAGTAGRGAETRMGLGC
jgi:hypothetical protein